MVGQRATERPDEFETAGRRLAFLFAATQELSVSLEPTVVLANLADLIVPEFGDAVRLSMRRSVGRAAQTVTTASEALFGLSQDWWNWADGVMRDGAKRSPGIGQSEYRSAAEQVPDYARRVNYIVVPLRVRGRTLGTLGLLAVPPRRPYSHEDLELLEALGNQAGVALDNARLYDDMRTVVADLRRVRRPFDDALAEWQRAEERRRIARDLHDEVQQTLFAIGLTAAAALDTHGKPPNQPAMVRALEQVGRLSNDGAEQLRGAIFGLRHNDYARLGLVQALWKLIRSFEQRTGIDTDLVLVGVPSEVPADVSDTLYAVAHEALANVERHARAKAAVLNLTVRKRSISLTVQDDGIGVTRQVLERVGSSTTHFGLGGLRERLRRLKGSLRLKPGAEGGLLVSARLPLLLTAAAL